MSHHQHKHYEVIMISKGYDTKGKLDAVDNADIKTMRLEALKSSTGAYIGCLFLKMANGRYKPVKKIYIRLSLRKNNNTRATCCP